MNEGTQKEMKMDDKNNRLIYRLKNIHDKYKRNQLFVTGTARTYEESEAFFKTVAKYSYKKRQPNANF